MNSNPERFALVTGSSRGIGRGIALALAQSDIHVAVNYLSNEKAALEVVSKIEKLGQTSFAVQADLRNANSVKELIEQVKQQFGRIDILVNNVGDFLMRPLAQMSIDDWRAMMDSNLNSTFFCCKYALEGMRRKGYGRIVNIALANASQVKAYKQVAAYAIAKTGVLILTKSLAIEEAKYGITVNAVSPGFVDNGSLSKEVRSDMQKQVPMGNLGVPQDIANAVIYLISEKAKYVTGAEIVVSGGWGL